MAQQSTQPRLSEAPAAPKGIHAKLVAVATDLGWIAKDKRNTAQNYDFTSAESVLAAVRAACATHGVDVSADVVEHSFREGGKTAKGAPIWFHVVKIAWTYSDAEDGKTVGPFHSVGEGQDSSDKAIYKAITGAMKYGLRMKFLIPMGNEPEVEDDADPEKDHGDGDEKPTPKTAAERVKEKVAAQTGKGDRLAAIVKGLEAAGFKTSAAREVKAKAILGHPFVQTSDADMAALEAWLAGGQNVNDAVDTLGAVAGH